MNTYNLQKPETQSYLLKYEITFLKIVVSTYLGLNLYLMSLIAQLHYLLALWPNDKSKRKRICKVISTIIIHHIGNQMYLCSLGLHFDKFQHFREK